jgi:predicted small secreted protein
MRLVTVVKCVGTAASRQPERAITAKETLTMKRILTVGSWVMMLASMAFVAACNTVEGAGQDIEATGDAIEDAADDAKD